jgi:HEPN domain-containing protein
MNTESVEWMARAEREYDAALDMYKRSFHRFALTHAQLGLMYAFRAVAIDRGFSPHETIDLAGIALLIEPPKEMTQVVSDIKGECSLISKGEYWQDPDPKRIGDLLDRAGDVMEWAECSLDHKCWSEKLEEKKV